MKPLLAPSPMRIFVRGKLLSLSLSSLKNYTAPRGVAVPNSFLSSCPSAFSRVPPPQRFLLQTKRERERGTNLAKLWRGGGGIGWYGSSPGRKKTGDFWPIAKMCVVVRGPLSARLNGKKHRANKLPIISSTRDTIGWNDVPSWRQPCIIGRRPISIRIANRNCEAQIFSLAIANTTSR